MGLSDKEKNDILEMQEVKVRGGAKKVQCPKCSICFLAEEAEAVKFFEN